MAPDERLIEDAVAAQIHAADPQTRLAAADFHDVLTEMQENVVSVMNRAGRDVMIDQDYAFIQRYVGKMVGLMLAKVETKLRFQKGDRVMCNVGGERRWASGTVQAVNERDPEDPTGRTVVAYVVKVDPPDARLVSAPRDSDELIFTECCFGQRADALWFTLLAMPLRSLKTRRFALGERVAVAVEDASAEYSVWRAGTVTELDCTVEADATGLLPEHRNWSGVVVPYKVTLDQTCKESGCEESSCSASGREVLVHRDEHWLVRDLALQPEGARTAADGTRCVARLSRRQRSDGVWEAVDHSTRRVRPEAEEEDDEEDDGDAPAEAFQPIPALA